MKTPVRTSRNWTRTTWPSKYACPARNNAEGACVSRILRQENYLIALFNKDLLDLRVRLPAPHAFAHLVPPALLTPPSQTALPSNSAVVERRYISFGANTLTKALEWNLRFCLMGYLFDRRGQVRKEFVRERRRKDLVEGCDWLSLSQNAIHADDCLARIQA